MNPLKIFEREPLDRTRLNWFTKIVVFFIEWIARFLASLYLSLILIILGVLPFTGMSKAFVRILYTFCNLYMMRWMPQELKDNGTGNTEPEGMEQTDDTKVSGMETKQ